MKKANKEFSLNKLIGKSIVLTWSGGLDTTALIPFLIEKYNCTVYPIFVNRGQTNVTKEKRSIKYYSKIFEERYGKKFKPVFEVSVRIPAKEFKKIFPKSSQRHSLRNSDIVNQAIRYALIKRINFVVVGSVISDASWKDNSLRYWKAKTKEIRLGTGNKNLLVMPVFVLLRYDKAKIIRWCDSKDIDLSKTWSCYEDTKQHCGRCDACKTRRKSFILACVTDGTGYLRRKR